MKTISIASCFFVVAMGVACADDDETTRVSETFGNGMGSRDAAVQGDGAEAEASANPEGGRTNESGAEAGADEGGGDAAYADGSDTGRAWRDGGPGGNGSVIVAADAASGDASFVFKNRVDTNLISYSDVHTICATVKGAVPGLYVMTCQEKPVTGGALCRTIMVTFQTTATSGPKTDQVFVAVARAAPALNEAVVVYQESADCSVSGTNGWSAAKAGGNLKVDNGGDTGMYFTLSDVSLAPAQAATVVNQNAAGTFTLGGVGFTTVEAG
ncbi:MAG TPA: hypothetical protein VJT73_08510 [Polyangiaceae bacterium]|nr:hypothetical protein [Polyangiaceae bacterium]